ncbi:pilus assembly protein [Paraburkholderia sp. D15]|uniref:TadE/TadG family type IV pilus assembly protein n=1 Tax=Paraburkholderia sp. D15 TaxID=2880218 RepID=UPI002478E1DE|nr:TadE/TadG family type IV pilus assembly protein [Paraburkholderia sp. D15]WGS51395.1 pilus assembly protein [Paraburkholderia sp. D15]
MNAPRAAYSRSCSCPSRQRRGTPARRTQRGSAAVEFAIVFPVLFMIMYGIVSFGLVMVAQQNLTLAAEEGARAALNWQSSTSLQNALYVRGQNACTTANQMAATLVQPYMTCTQTSAPCGNGNTMQCISVTLTYDYLNHPIVPNIPLLGVTIPNTLYSMATVQLNPENVQ